MVSSRGLLGSFQREVRFSRWLRRALAKSGICHPRGGVARAAASDFVGAVVATDAVDAVLSARTVEARGDAFDKCVIPGDAGRIVAGYIAACSHGEWKSAAVWANGGNAEE